MGSADAVDLVTVVALAHVAKDREVREVHVPAGRGRIVAVEPDPIALRPRVPHPRPANGDVVDRDMPENREGARRDPHRAARARRRDGLVHRRGRVPHAGRIGTPAGDRDGPGGLPQRRGDVLKIGKIDCVRRCAVARTDLEAELRARRVGRREQSLRLVVEVVRVAAGRVGERVGAVIPAVRVGQHEVGGLHAVDGEGQRRGVRRSARAVRNAVPEDDRVGRHRGGELDILAGPLQGDRLAEGRLGGQLAVGGGRADHGAVGGGVLRLHLDVRQGGTDSAGRGRLGGGRGQDADSGGDQGSALSFANADTTYTAS